MVNDSKPSGTSFQKFSSHSPVSNAGCKRETTPGSSENRNRSSIPCGDGFAVHATPRSTLPALTASNCSNCWLPGACRMSKGAAHEKSFAELAGEMYPNPSVLFTRHSNELSPAPCQCEYSDAHHDALPNNCAPHCRNCQSRRPFHQQRQQSCARRR